MRRQHGRAGQHPAPVALLHRTGVEKLSPSEAEARLSARVGSVVLAGDFDYRESVMGDDQMLLTQHAILGRFSLLSHIRGVHIVSASGSAHWSSGTKQGSLDRAPVLFRDGDTVETHSTGLARPTTVTFEPHRLTELAKGLYGPKARLSLDSRVPMDTAHAARWREAVQSTWRLPLEMPLIRHHAYTALAAAAFESFHLPLDEGSPVLVAGARQRLFKRATAHLENHAEEPINALDAAIAVGIGISDLRRLFVAYSETGETPERFLVRARLRGARRTLLEDPAASVRDTALQWGFLHPGRFVRLFLEEFGEPPHLRTRYKAL